MAESTESTAGCSDTQSNSLREMLGQFAQELDAKWERRFEALRSEIDVRKRSRSPASTSDRSSPQPKSIKKGARENRSDDELSIHEEGELAEEEEMLLSQKLQSEETDKNFLKDIEEEYKEDESLGAKVRDDLAKVVNGRFRAKLGEEMLKKRFGAHDRPENCDALVIPSVNKEIWTQLPIHARKTDLKLAQVQRCIVKSAVAVTRVVNELLDKPNACSEQTKRQCTDAIAMLGHAAQEMSGRRRAAIKPHVNKALHRICDDIETVPVTDKLFGNDLTASLKEVKELDRLGASITPDDSRKGWHAQNERRGPFLGKHALKFKGQRPFKGGAQQRPRDQPFFRQKEGPYSRKNQH